MNNTRISEGKGLSESMAVLSMGYAGSIGITMDHNPGCGTEAFDDITWQGEHFHLGTDVRETHVSTRWDLVTGSWDIESEKSREPA